MADARDGKPNAATPRKDGSLWFGLRKPGFPCGLI